MKRKAFAKVHEVDGSPKDYKATKGILESKFQNAKQYV